MSENKYAGTQTEKTFRQHLLASPRLATSTPTSLP